MPNSPGAHRPTISLLLVALMLLGWTVSAHAEGPAEWKSLKLVKIDKKHWKRGKTLKKARAFKAMTLTELNQMRDRDQKGKRGAQLKETSAIAIPLSVWGAGSRGAKAAKTKKLSVKKYLRQYNKWEKRLNKDGLSLRDWKRDVELETHDMDEAKLKEQMAAIDRKYKKAGPLRVRNLPKQLRGMKTLFKVDKNAKVTPLKKERSRGIGDAVKKTAEAVGKKTNSRGSKFTWTKRVVDYRKGSRRTASAELTNTVKIEASRSGQYSIGANTEAKVYVLNHRIKLASLDTSIKVDTKKSMSKRGRVRVNAMILGSDKTFEKYYPVKSGSTISKAQISTTKWIKSYSIKHRIWLGPVPVTVKLSAKIEAGVRGAPHLSERLAVINIRPYAEADLTAKVYLNAFIARAGVKGNVGLFDVGLPVTGFIQFFERTVDYQKAKQEYIQTAVGAKIAGSRDGDNSASFLDGYVKVFAEVFCRPWKLKKSKRWCSYSKKLLSWKGYEVSKTLLNEESGVIPL